MPVGSLWSAASKESNARNRPRCSIKNFGDEANHASSCSPRFLPLNSSIDSLKTEKAEAGPDGHLPPTFPAADLLKRRFIRRKVVDTKIDSGNNSPSFASEHDSPLKPPKPLKRKSKRVGAHREPGVLESRSKCRSPSGPPRVHANAQQVACNVRHTSVVGSMKVLRKGHDSFRETRWHREF